MRQSLSEAQIGLKLLFSFQSARGHLCHLGCKRLQFKASPGYRTRFCLKKPTNQPTINKALLVFWGCLVASWIAATSFSHCLSVPCGRPWSMSTDTMGLGKDCIAAYLWTTSAAFPLKLWLSRRMKLWNNFSTLTKRKKLWFVMVFLCKSLEENIYIYVTLIVRKMLLLEGDVCLVTGTTGILILDFCMFLSHGSKVFSRIFCFPFDGI